MKVSFGVNSFVWKHLAVTPFVMTFLQTSTFRKLLITEYLRPGNGGYPPGQTDVNRSAKGTNNVEGNAAKTGGGEEGWCARKESNLRPTGS
jgi:hypothetical protein